ncbi:MAG: HPr family phosphocarrier protein [Clostridiaceae bacterium]|nr:HPr family phosphocarrier protein [Clostridiaceae bacterium]
MKHTIDIKFLSISDVKEFADIVSAFNYDIDLISGRYVVDAKSIMGIFSLDLSKPISLVAHTDNILPLAEAIKKFC